MYKYRIIEIKNFEPIKIGAGGSQSVYAEPSTEYIPGSTIRGALIAQMIRLGLFNEDTKRDFLLGMEYYNAYPYLNDALYLPTPLHLRTNKHKWRKAKKKDEEIIKLFNLMLPEKVNTQNEEYKTNKNYLGYSFVTKRNNYLQGMKVDREYRLHHSTCKNQGNEENKDRENLFRYQAISAGQCFRAIIKYKSELEKQMRILFSENHILYLGGSKGSGYGKSQVCSLGEPLTDYKQVKKEIGITFSENFNNGNQIIITCLSDCLFRNEFGQPINHISEKYLNKVTGKKFKLADKLFAQTGQTEGYNTTWKARYPKETTLKSGSVLKYELEENESMESGEMQKVIDLLEKTLMGSRTHDGYGWLAVNIDYPLNMFVKWKKSDVNSITSHLDNLDNILKKAKVKATFDTLLSGMNDAKQRWLDMLCIKCFNCDDEDEKKQFFISDKLKNTQIKKMEDIIIKWLKSDSADEQLETHYANDNKILALRETKFNGILGYLNGSDNKKLSEFAHRKLNSKQGKLFYFDKIHSDYEKTQRQFIADLLRTGLYIKRRCKHE